MSVLGDRDGLGAQPVAPLYERLPHGPHHKDHEEVVHNQRQRLQGALIESIATRGYHDTSVKYILALAGVSRRCFYEQYKNKRDCFLQTFREIAQRSTERIAANCDAADGDLQESLLGALDAMAAEVVEHPKQARLMFSEIDYLGHDGAIHVARLMSGFERRLAERLGADAPRPLLKGLIGSIRAVVCLLHSERRLQDLPNMDERILGWLLLAMDPSALALHDLMRSEAKDRVRAARQSAANAIEVVGDPRQQLLRAALRAARETQGNEMSAIQVADAAGLSLDTFFEYYPEHEQCFKEALDGAAERLLGLVTEPDQRSSPWPVQVSGSIESVLSELARDEMFTWTITRAATESGPWGIEYNRRLARNLALTICAPIPAEMIDEITIEQTAGAIWHTVWCMQEAGRTHLLGALHGYISYLVLAPIIGGQEALTAIEQSSASDRGTVLATA